VNVGREGQIVTCRPDAVVTSTDGLHVALGASAKPQLKSNVLELSAAGLIVSLTNLEKSTSQLQNFPIPLLQLRGTEISAGNVYYPPKYLQGWRQGYIESAPNLPDFRMYTQPRLAPTDSNLIIGADLRSLKEREIAVKLIAQMKSQAIINSRIAQKK